MVSCSTTDCNSQSSPKYVLAIDQGTTSTRTLVFKFPDNIPVSKAQRFHRQIQPYPGWVEHDPEEIYAHVLECIEECLTSANLQPHETITSIGITNQRQTTVLWQKTTGKPIYNAIVWQDTRTQETLRKFMASLSKKEPTTADSGTIWHYRERTGNPLTSFPSAPKIQWLLDNVPNARDLAAAGDLMFGTIDCWILWNLSGRGVHATDASNAMCTMLADIETLQWSDQICHEFTIPMNILPEIKPNGQVFGYCRSTQAKVWGVPIGAILGDQQASLFGHGCVNIGDTKVTYGSGAFVLMNTGSSLVRSVRGNLSQVAWHFDGHQPTYCLEGSIATAGTLLTWLKDELKLVQSHDQVEDLAASVSDAGDCYVIPAFSGLFSPYWEPETRGAIVGLTMYNCRARLVRAALDAVAFQVADILDCMDADGHGLVNVTQLRVDGGLSKNKVLMQSQADMVGRPIAASMNCEISSLGIALAAGYTAGLWTDIKLVNRDFEGSAHVYEPSSAADCRAERLAGWRHAVNFSIKQARTNPARIAYEAASMETGELQQDVKD